MFKRILTLALAFLLVMQAVAFAAEPLTFNFHEILYDDGVDEGNGKVYKLVNPVITKKKGEQVCREGCLSVPGVLGDVIRPKKVVVEALNEKDKKVRIKAEDLLAVVFSHEIDHLDGVLFVDRATDIYEASDEEEE